MYVDHAEWHRLLELMLDDCDEAQRVEQSRVDDRDTSKRVDRGHPR